MTTWYVTKINEEKNTRFLWSWQLHVETCPREGKLRREIYKQLEKKRAEKPLYVLVYMKTILFVDQVVLCMKIIYFTCIPVLRGACSSSSFFFSLHLSMRRSEIHGFILPFAKPSSVACITFISAADITTYPALLQMQKQQYNLPLLALITVSLLNANHSKGWNLALILHCSY